MGSGVDVKCNNCGYQDSFMFGIGMYHSSLEHCLVAFNKQIIEEVMSLIEENELKDYDFEYKAFQCEACSSLFNQASLVVQFENEKSYHSKHICPNCHNEEEYTEITEEAFEKIPCSTCKKAGSLELILGMIWD